MRFTKHSYWFFLLLSVMNLNFVYAELPPPRIWIYETSHDMTRKTKQMVRKFHGSLKQSMKRSKRLEVEDGKAIKRRDLNAEVSKAESYKYSGIEAFREKKYDEAQKILRSSLKLYSKHVASVKEVEAIFQTLIYLAASYTELEYDGDAKDYYRQLAAVAPKNFSLGKDFSAKVNKKYKKEQKRLLKKKRGMIEVKTTPPGAEVWVDGVKRCVSPCQVKDLVRGVHYIKVNKAKTGFNGGIVKVKAGWSTPVKYSLQKQPQGAKKQVVAASLLKQIKGKLEQAQIDAQFRQHAETIAQEQDVNFVLITHLMRDRRKVTLFSYLYGNESKRLFVIEPTTFSARFSAAQITAMNLVRKVEKIVSRLPSKSHDGIHAPLLALIKQNKNNKILAVAPSTPSKPNRVNRPQNKKTTPNALSSNPNPRYHSSASNQKPLIEDTPRKSSDNSVLKSPWFWGGVGVVVVGAIVTTAVLVSDSQSENARFETKVSW